MKKKKLEEEVVCGAEPVRQIKTILDTMEKKVMKAKDDLSYSVDLIEDLLHRLEFEDLTFVEQRQCAQQIREARIARRNAKNTLDAFNQIYLTLDRCGVIKGVQQALREAEMADRQRVHKVYCPRVLDAKKFFPKSSIYGKEKRSGG